MPTSTPKRRADAERNIETILRATHELMAHGTLPSMSDVATASGIGRVTLYSHFPSREVLLEEVLRRGIAHTDQVLTELALDEQPPAEALALLVRKSWPILDRHRRVRTIALAEIGPEPLRRHHDAAFQHVGRLIERGRAAGAFRTDQPVDWLVATFYAILHAAADEVAAGRLTSADAPGLLISTLLSALRP
ncbi:TetR/AcrR family transcriptional regulator [Kribbella sp. NPDC051620]|uniref:TetR/AcrR family transcriptional regulator n=1 Tax=Kribbella sp. NPDC051620 TaxID=3364120 RepID=UPI0037B55D57